MRRRLSPRKKFYTAAVTALAILTILSIKGNGMFRPHSHNYSRPALPETETYSDKEKEEILGTFTANVRNSFNDTVETVTGSRTYSVAVKALGDTVSGGKELWAGISDYGKEDSSPGDTGDTVRNIQVTVPLHMELASVIHVADGDTVLVQPLFCNDDRSSLFHLDVFEPVYVRLAGINTPESSAAEKSGYAASTPEGEEASSFTKSVLSEGQLVWLSTATSDESDQYGRLLRLLWTEQPDDSDIYSDKAVKDKTLNALLLKEGKAEPMFIGTFEYESLFSSIAVTD